MSRDAGGSASPGDLERLCRALGFEPTGYVHYQERTFKTSTPDAWIAKGGRLEWPPIDTDVDWAVRAMKAAANLPPGLPARVSVAVWPTMDGSGKWRARWRGGAYVDESTFELAVYRALITVLKAGERSR